MMKYIDQEQQKGGSHSLIGLTLGLAFGTASLYALAGPPHLPTQLPSLEEVATTLRGSEPPLAALAYVLTTVAWTVWFYLVASFVLRLLVDLADVFTRGATWVRVLRVVSDRVTLPIMRRVVDGALVAVVVVSLAVRSTPGAAAAAPAPTTVAITAETRIVIAGQTSGVDGHADRASEAIEYVVQPGDTLWTISERFYVTGHEFPRLVEANLGRLMPDGQRFTEVGVIQPGWVLQIPLPSTSPERVDGETTYVVAPGDTLRGIAARLLGNESRWSEIFEFNRGMASLPDGRVLTDPDLIWPGLCLRLPLPALAEPTQQVPAPEDLEPPPVPAAVEPTPPPATTPTPEAPSESTPVPASLTPAVETPTLAPTAADVTAAPPLVVATPEATEKPRPVSTPVVAIERDVEQDEEPSPLMYGAAALTAAALAGGVALLVRRQVRRSLKEAPAPPPPRPGPPPGDDFAEADPARVLVHRLHGGEVEPIVVAAEQVRRFLDEQEIHGASIVLGYQGRNALTLLFEVGLREQPSLLELVEPFAARLGATVQAGVTPDHDVVWRLSRLRAAGLLTPVAEGEGCQLSLLALGLAPSGETLYVNWHTAGHVLVAGLPGGPEVVLTSLIAAVAARCRPEMLSLWTVVSSRTLPSQLAALPHQVASFVDPEDKDQVNAVLNALRAEVVLRMRDSEQLQSSPWCPQPDEPELVLVIDELGNVEDDGTTLELIASYGPAVGVRLVAATTRPSLLDEAVLAHFSTRFVLQMLDDEESVQLLGRPDAADLGSGELFVRLDGRAPVHARGFRVSTEHLDDLIRLMWQFYGSPHANIPRVIDGPEEPRTAASSRASNGPIQGEDESSVADELNAASDSARGWHEGEPGGTGTAEPIVLSPGEPGPVIEDGAVEDGYDRTHLASADEQHINDEHGEMLQAQTAPADPSVAGLDDNSTHDESLKERVESRPAVGKEPSEPISAKKALVAGLLQVRCFGEFTVTSDEREITPIGEEGTSYKAWEILAFLAAQPGGAVSRDKLLAAIWPDIDSERAANRMRVAMARLRALLASQVPELAADVVRCERDGTCRLDTRVVWSDAHAFWDLCRAATKFRPEEAKEALEQARGLYRGDLFAGRGVRVYEWLDERDDAGLSPREEYREEYYRATMRLARLYRQEGQSTRAVPLYKSLLRAEPTLEDVVREIYRCYQQLGDLGSLIREDRHLRQALREAYHDPSDPHDDPEHHQPVPETVELFNQVRAELEAGVASASGRVNRRG